MYFYYITQSSHSYIFTQEKKIPYVHKKNCMQESTAAETDRAPLVINT